MPLSYSLYQSTQPKQEKNYAPKRARQAGGDRVHRARIHDASTPMGAPIMGRRQISLTPESPSTQVRVVDTEGHIIGNLTPGVRNTELRGRGDIASILVTVEGQERTCDMAPALEWIDTATHIGLTTSGKKGIPSCTLSDMSAGVNVPDVWGVSMGRRCVYVSDQRGTSGLECH